jgi:hypothetical protein
MHSSSKFQCHSSQSYKKINSKFIWKHKKPNNQVNHEQKRATEGIIYTWLQIILQSHSDKNSLTLAQKQTGKPMK